MTSPVGLKGLAKKALAFKASPAWPLRPLLASLGLPGQAFGGLSRPPKANFGFTWRRLACLGLPWPHLVWLRALPCPAVGVPNLRSYRPWRCFLRVRLLPSKRESGADKGPQGRLWPGFMARLASIWPAFGGQFGRKDGIENQRKFETKIRNENHQKFLPGASKIRSIFDPEKLIPRGCFSAGRPRPPQGLPRGAQGCPRPPFGRPLGSYWSSLGPSWVHFGTNFRLP